MTPSFTPASMQGRQTDVRRPRSRAILWAGVALLATNVQAEVRLSELMAAPNERRLAPDDQGRSRPGSGRFWADPGPLLPGWKAGRAPLGYGGGAGLGTDLASLIRGRTPGLYIRRLFTATAADLANQGKLEVRVAFNDGCVVFLNGREAGRANAGPPGHFIHHDQPAYNFASSTNDSRYQPAAQPGVGGPQPMILTLGSPAEWLRDGENVLAIHLLNREPNTATRIDAALAIVPAPATVTLHSEDFAEANGASVAWRMVQGSAGTTTSGAIPPGSWLDVAPPPTGSPQWQELEVTRTLDPEAGRAGGGAWRVEYEQLGPNQPAQWYGAPIELGDAFGGSPPGATELASLTLGFRFRATTETGYDLWLEPEPGQRAAALGGLPPLTATSGTAAAETAPDTFSDSVNGHRSLAVSATGVTTRALSGTVRNSLTLSAGPAMRDFAFQVVEDSTAGAGGDGSSGHLRCEVTKAAATPDAFGFTLQTFTVRSWTAGAITPNQLEAVALEFIARAPSNVPVRVWLEPATVAGGPAQRLDLGSFVGSGAWQPVTFHPALGTNQASFLGAMNAQATNLVRVAFRCEVPVPAGTAWQVDSIGFVPWRTYTAPLAAATNVDAFLAALATQPAPRFFPVWEKTGTAPSPARSRLIIDDFAVTRALSMAGVAKGFVDFNAPDWHYWPGLAEPSGGLVEPADFATAGAEPEFSDWIEIENTGPSNASLNGWGLTTRPEGPPEWTFPAGTELAAGNRLVVLASGRTAPANASWIHLPFKLPEEGAYLALVDAAGQVRDGLDPGFGPQDSFHSYGRNNEGLWGYLRTASPGEQNTGAWSPHQAAPVEFSVPGGFHDGPVTLTLISSSPDNRIVYTLDGSEPSETNGLLYTAPIALAPINDKSGHPVRARALRDGWLPSPVTTHTYLIAQHANLRRAPAIALTGDPGHTFYRPTGIFAIQGGTYASDLWVPQKNSDYNMPLGSGRSLDPAAPQRPYERPAYFEFLPIDGQEPLGAPVGVRVSSSPYSRPRLRLTQAASASPFSASETEKPSLNVFFRDDYGTPDITYPLIPETAVRRFEEFRLRAGKNDLTNPFIRDEYVRRLFVDLGQTGTVGSFNGLWINGIYKGYYNLCERIREAFLQNHHPGSGQWDVNYIDRFEDGDSTHFNSTLTPRLNANLSQRTNFDALAAVFDLNNAADYYLLNVYCAMWDWPQNNWAMARERASTGRWRCYVWDAEGSFGLYGNKGTTWNTFSQDLLTRPEWLSSQFRRLMSSAEWRLIFADRVQRHFFNGGALTDARLTARKNSTAAEVQPFLAHAGLSPDTSWFTGWMSATSGRKRVLFPRNMPGQAGYAAGHFRDPNGDGNLNDTLWPLTLAPTLGLEPGEVTAGTSVSLGLAPGVPAESTIYYTINGVDPRVWGGAAAAEAQVYSGPIQLPSSLSVVRARVRHATTGEWSPLTEAAYRVGTVPAAADNLVVSELMYHPPPPTAAELAAGFRDPDDFEYLTLTAIGAAPVDLSGVRFSEGVSFDAANASPTVLDPGTSVLVVRNRTAVTFRYGAAIGSRIIGEFFGGLSNGGEALRLENKADGATLKSFRYSDAAPWPAGADGGGRSLVLREPATNPDHSLPLSWTVSAALGGQPTGQLLPLTYPTWAAWALSEPLRNNVARSAPHADADGDGWSNEFEFHLSGDAENAASKAAMDWRRLDGPDGGRLEVTVILRPGATGATVSPESSTDLASQVWQNDFTAESPVPMPDGSVRQTWYRPLASPSLFFRLRLVPHPSL